MSNKCIELLRCLIGAFHQREPSPPIPDLLFVCLCLSFLHFFITPVMFPGPSHEELSRLTLLCIKNYPLFLPQICLPYCSIHSCFIDASLSNKCPVIDYKPFLVLLCLMTAYRMGKKKSSLTPTQTEV